MMDRFSRSARPKRYKRRAAALLLAACLAGGVVLPIHAQEARYAALIKRQLGTFVSDRARGLAVDADANVFITGATDFQLHGNTWFGSSDLFLSKYDAAGDRLWTTQWGTNATDNAITVALDGLGNAYVGGATRGMIDGQPNAGLTDGLLTKLDASGNLLWTRQWGTAQNESTTDVAADPTHGVFVTGRTYGSLVEDGFAGIYDPYLRRFDADGNVLWTRQFGGLYSDTANGVAVDAAGNAYVVGHTNSQLGDATFGGPDVFVTKFDIDGNQLWTTQYGTGWFDEGAAIALASSGHLYVTGYTEGQFDGGPEDGLADVLLTKLDLSGNIIWNKQFGQQFHDRGTDLAVDDAGNAYITGNMSGALPGEDVGGGTDALLYKVDADGQLLWARQLGTTGTDWGYAASIGPDAKPYIAGETTGRLGDDAPLANGFDAFWFKYDNPILGDTDEDWDIDDADLANHFARYTGPVGGAGGRYFSDGDSDLDGDVDDADLAIAFANYTGPIDDGPAIPEPTSLALLIIGGLSCCRRRGIC